MVLMEYFEYLPLEITLDILTRVPSESVLDCKSVCKTWNNLVSQNPSFSKMHFHHLNNHNDSGKLCFIAKTIIGNNHEKIYYFEYNENLESTIAVQRITRFNFTLPFRATSFVGSCNGLLCLVGGSYLHLKPFICNPITKEYVMLPDSKTYYPYTYCSLGFGCVSSTNEYKVVGMHVRNTNTEVVEVHIYTLGSGLGWRNLGNFNSEFAARRWQQGVFANGALYWIGKKLEMIVTFDLAEEKFREHLAPTPLWPENNWYKNKIGVLDGFLFLGVWLVVKGDPCYDVWLLKTKNDNHDMKEQLDEHQSWVWRKEFRIDERDLFAVTKTGGVLTYFGNYLNIYDTKASTSKWLVDFKEQIWNVFPHKSTLVSLKELGEEDTKTMESIEIEEIESHDKPSVIGG